MVRIIVAVAFLFALAAPFAAKAQDNAASFSDVMSNFQRDFVMARTDEAGLPEGTFHRVGQAWKRFVDAFTRAAPGLGRAHLADDEPAFNDLKSKLISVLEADLDAARSAQSSPTYARNELGRAVDARAVADMFQMLADVRAMELRLSPPPTQQTDTSTGNGDIATGVEAPPGGPTGSFGPTGTFVPSGLFIGQATTAEAWDVPGQTACGGVFDTNGDDMNVNGVGGGIGWVTDGTTRVGIEFLHQRGDHKKRTGQLNVNRNIRCNQVNGGTQLQNPGAVPLSETRLKYNLKQTKIGVSADTVIGQSGPIQVIFGVGAGVLFRDTDTVFEIKVDQFNFMSKTTNEIDTDRLFAELSGGLQFPVIGQVIGHVGATLIVDYDSVNGTSTYNETVVPTTQVRELSDSEVNPSFRLWLG
jgi:hypothetical protein